MSGKVLGYRLQMKLVTLRSQIHTFRPSRKSVYCDKKIEIENLSLEATEMFKRFMAKAMQEALKK